MSNLQRLESLASHLFEGGVAIFDSETVETSVVNAMPHRLIFLSN